jgi:hypothetical protein
VLDDARILALFRQQYGVASTDQLAAIGFPRRTIYRWRDRGALIDVLPRVVRLASSPTTFAGTALAVQLQTAPVGVLSGPTAARLYRLRNMPDSPIFAASLARPRSMLPSWIDLAHCPWLDDADTQELHVVFRVLRPLPMLLSVAAQFNDHRFERAAEDAWHRKLITPTDAATYLEDVRRRGRHGVARFARWVDRAAERPRPSQSHFEIDIVDVVARVGLPEPVRQHPLVLPSGETIHLDLAWPAIRLAVEPGHSWWHGGDLRMRKDAARDRACSAVGWQVVRYDEQARRDLDEVGRELVQLHAARTRALRSNFGRL